MSSVYNKNDQSVAQLGPSWGGGPSLCDRQEMMILLLQGYPSGAL